ncbi:hypothetical protein B0A52_09768 [Exophiala mesophila]|uniref:Impact N-terminal domain-containing protein n=1 Tax=Exophiala mesophila TaxID=212818 RepID=A0A438MS64_EXOME|nr:hypothetical protein B0A52_09768 [Exophiala mesophila]
MTTSSSAPSNKRPLAVENDDNVYISTPIHDRSSTFIAHFHPGDPSVTPSSTSSDKPRPVSLTQSIKAVQSHPDFASADHKMVAWRRRSNQRTLNDKATYTTGSDDDGEKYAGKRLERVLVDLDVQGTVVVARWYGGVLLGPVRFTHIEMVAREAIKMWQRASHGNGGNDADSVKRPRVTGDNASGTTNGGDINVADDAQRARLARQLVERDKSILILRDLLSEKTKLAPDTAAASGGSDSQSSQQHSTPLTATPAASSGAVSTASTIKPIDYTEMPLQRLRQLDKARDATIAFILKQIDKAEESIKAAPSPVIARAKINR